MRRLSSWLTLAALAAFTLGAAGCNPEVTTTTANNTSSDGDHDHDDHDHDGHDHDAHDHGDHEGHEHDGHDHENMTLASLLGEIEETRSEIAAAFEKGSPGDAHDSMHEVGHLLNDLTSAGEKLELDESQMKQLESAQESLLDAFGAIDEGMHGDGGKTYTEVESDIQSAMKTLQGFVPAPNGETAQ